MIDKNAIREKLLTLSDFANAEGCPATSNWAREVAKAVSPESSTDDIVAELIANTATTLGYFESELNRVKSAL